MKIENWAIQTSFVGDAILTLPFIYRFLELNQNEKLLLVAAPRNKALFDLALTRGLSQFKDRLEIVSWDKKSTRNPLKLLQFAKELHTQWGRPQNVFCIQRSFSTALLAFLSKAQQRLGFSSGAAHFLYTHTAHREWDSGYHEIEKNLDLLRLLNPVLEWGTESKSLLATTKKIPTKDKVVAFSLASPWATKEWDLEEASELMKKLINEGTEVYLLGDKSFLERSLLLEKNLNSRLLKNFTAKTPFTAWLDLIAQSDLLISGDSAAVHIASDIGVPVIALFGPTVPEFGFAPWRKNGRVLSLDMECRPCDIHGPKRCPLKHHNCLKNIKAEKVYGFVTDILSEA